MKVKYQDRPVQEKLKVITIRMPSSLLKTLKNESAKYKITRQRLITEVLKAALKDKKLEIYLKD
jgi:predicted DNA binding CopG/RHH family protein